MRRGRARRQRVALVALAAAAVSGVSLAVNAAREDAGPLPRASVTYDAKRGPSSYLAYTVPGPDRPTGPATMTIRAVRDGRVLATIPTTTDVGSITGFYARGDRDIYLLRLLDDGRHSSCGGTVVRRDAATGRETAVLTLPADRALTAMAPSPGNRWLAYALAPCGPVLPGDLATGENVSLHTRSLADGEDVQAGRDDLGRIEALAWSPDAQRLAVLGPALFPSGSDKAFFLDRSDLAATNGAFVDMDPGCGMHGLAWGRGGLFWVQSCAAEGAAFRPTEAEYTVTNWNPDGAHASPLPLPACSLGSGISADVVTGHVLVWVNSTAECGTTNRILRLQGDELVDVSHPDDGTLTAAIW